LIKFRPSLIIQKNVTDKKVAPIDDLKKIDKTLLLKKDFLSIHFEIYVQCGAEVLLR